MNNMPRNMHFEGFKYVEEYNRKLPVVVLVEETAETWNAKARVQNTLMFIELVGREPKDYQEVRDWVDAYAYA